ncbi:MAG: hypothetical protein ACLTXI_08420 [Collinsella sp.]
MKKCGRAAELIVEPCIKRVGIAFDGKAWTIIVLADVHGDELFGAIGNKFARGFGGLAVGEVPLCGQDALLKKAGVRSFAQHSHIVVAFECENSTVFEDAYGLARQLSGVGGKPNGIIESIESIGNRIDDIVRC